MKNIYDRITKGTGLIDHYVFRHLVYHTIKLFGFKNIHPNYIVGFNLLFSILCSYLVSSGNKNYAILGAVLFLFYDYFDLLDGAVARLHSKTSKFGAFFDGITDVISENLILFALYYYFSNGFFLYLIIFNLFSMVVNLRIKWILDEKESQLNILTIKRRTILENIKYILVLATRNDARKILIILGITISSPLLIILYFFIFDILALMNNLRVISSK